MILLLIVMVLIIRYKKASYYKMNDKNEIGPIITQTEDETDREAVFSNPTYQVIQDDVKIL